MEKNAALLLVSVYQQLGWCEEKQRGNRCGLFPGSRPDTAPGFYLLLSLLSRDLALTNRHQIQAFDVLQKGVCHVCSSNLH